MEVGKRITEPFQVVFRNRELIIEMSKKEIRDRYKGQPLGMFWAVFHPLIMILVYIFLYGVVFRTRVQIGNQDTLTFTAYLLSGMIPWLCIQSAMQMGSVSVISNAIFIKQVIFPVEVFPAKAVGSAFIIEMIYLVIDVVYCSVSGRVLLGTYLLIPYILLIQAILLLGINYIISSISVYLKDVKDVVQVLCVVGVYVMPVIYLPEAVPQMFRILIYMNPLSYYIWMFQDVLFYGSIEHWYAWVVGTGCSLLVFYMGHFIFKKLKVGFGSAL